MRDDYPRCGRTHDEDGRSDSCVRDAAHADRHRDSLGYEWPDVLVDKHGARGAVVEHASRLGMPNPGQTIAIFDGNLRLLENVQKALDCTREQLAILFAAGEEHANR